MMKNFFFLLLLSALALVLAPLRVSAMMEEEKKKDKELVDSRETLKKNADEKWLEAQKKAAEKVNNPSADNNTETKVEAFVEKEEIVEDNTLKPTPNADARLNLSESPFDEESEKEDLSDLGILEPRLQEAQKVIADLRGKGTAISEQELLNLYEKWSNRYKRYKEKADVLERANNIRTIEGKQIVEGQQIENLLEELVRESVEIVSMLLPAIDLSHFVPLTRYQEALTFYAQKSQAARARQALAESRHSLATAIVKGDLDLEGLQEKAKKEEETAWNLKREELRARERIKNTLRLDEKENVNEVILSETTRLWSSFTSAKKKTELAKLCTSAQKAETSALVAEQLALSSADTREKRIALWNEAHEQASKLKAAWTEIAELYQKEKEHPPYWIKSRWISEFEAAENKKAFWRMKHLVYDAKKEELGIDNVITDPQKENETAVLLANVASLWEYALKYSQVNYDSASERFKKEWKGELQKIKQGGRDYRDRLIQYAHGRVHLDPRIETILKKPYTTAGVPTPLSSLSEEEQEVFPGGRVVAFREFLPTPKEKGSFLNSTSHDENLDLDSKLKVHAKIIKTKSGEVIRVEELIYSTSLLGDLINPSSSQIEELKAAAKDPTTLEAVKDHLIAHREMEAGDLLITLPEGMSKEMFLKELTNIPGAQLEEVFEKLRIYQFSFKPDHEEQWEEVWERAFEEAIRLNVKPEPDFFFRQR